MKKNPVYTIEQGKILSLNEGIIFNAKKYFLDFCDLNNFKIENIKANYFAHNDNLILIRKAHPPNITKGNIKFSRMEINSDTYKEVKEKYNSYKDVIIFNLFPTDEGMIFINTPWKHIEEFMERKIDGPIKKIGLNLYTPINKVLECYDSKQIIKVDAYMNASNDRSQNIIHEYNLISFLNKDEINNWTQEGKEKQMATKEIKEKIIMKQPKKKISFESRDYTLSYIIESYNSGIFSIPIYQRGYVWDKEKRSKLIDSILKGYPIGTIIIWWNNGKGYILDGQQRTRSLEKIRTKPFADLTIETFTEIIGGKNVDVSAISSLVNSLRSKHINELYYNEGERDDNDYQCNKVNEIEKIINKHKTQLIFNNVKLSQIINKLTNYVKQLYFGEFKIHSLDIHNASEKEATIIFERLNTEGVPLTKFEILSAHWSWCKIKTNKELYKSIESMYEDDSIDEETNKRVKNNILTPGELLLSLVLKTFKNSRLFTEAFLIKSENSDILRVNPAHYDRMIWIFRTLFYIDTKDESKLKNIKNEHDVKIADFINRKIAQADNPNEEIEKIIDALDKSFEIINSINILLSIDENQKMIFSKTSKSMLISLLCQILYKVYLGQNVDKNNIVNNLVYSILTNEYASSTTQTIGKNIIGLHYLEHEIEASILNKRISTLEEEQQERTDNQKGFSDITKFIITFAYSKHLKNKQLRYDFDHIVPLDFFSKKHKRTHFGKNSIGNSGQLNSSINRGEKSNNFDPDEYAHDQLVNISESKIDKKIYKNLLENIIDNPIEKNFLELYKFRFEIIKTLFLDNISQY